MSATTRAWLGAVKAAPGAFLSGIAIGIVANASIIHIAGASVIVGMTVGALVALLRR